MFVQSRIGQDARSLPLYGTMPGMMLGILDRYKQRCPGIYPGTREHTPTVFVQRCPKVSFWVLNGFEQKGSGTNSINARASMRVPVVRTHKFLGKMTLGIRIDLWATVREGERV